MIRLRHLAAVSAVAFLLTVAAPPLSTPMLAQGIVFDPNNYAQNVLTAAVSCSRSTTRSPRCKIRRRC